MGRARALLLRGGAAYRRRPASRARCPRIGARSRIRWRRCRCRGICEQLKAWAEKSGIPFWATPQAKNTVDVRRPQRLQALQHLRDLPDRRALLARLHVPPPARRQGDSRCTTGRSCGGSFPRTTGARRRASPPREARASRSAGRSGRVPRAAVRPGRRLLLEPAPAARCRRRSGFPNGLANSSGLVGRYMNGHAFMSAQIELDAEIYPGMNDQHSLISRQFFRCATDKPFVRHDLRVWESSAGREPRLKSSDGRMLMGDALLADWRARTTRGTARVRAYYDVHPVARQPADARRGGEEPLWRPAAEDRPQARRGHRGASAGHASVTSTRSSPASRASTTAGSCRRAKATTSIIRPAAAAWARDPADERLRQLRPHPRSREPVRRRRADAADGRLHERHADLRGVDAAVGGTDGVNPRRFIGTPGWAIPRQWMRQHGLRRRLRERTPPSRAAVAVEAGRRPALQPSIAVSAHLEPVIVRRFFAGVITPVFSSQFLIAGTIVALEPTRDTSEGDDQMGKIVDFGTIRPYRTGMALPAVKTTYSMDQETIRLLDQLAEKWGESRSGALRRAIRDAASAAGVNDRLAALDAWQKSMALSPAAAKAWADESRAERRASSRKSIERIERASRVGRRRSK